MQTVLSGNVLARAGWTGLQIVIALAITQLGGVPTWWAAPLAMMLSAVKTNVIDRLAAKSE